MRVHFTTDHRTPKLYSMELTTPLPRKGEDVTLRLGKITVEGRVRQVHHFLGESRDTAGVFRFASVELKGATETREP